MSDDQSKRNLKRVERTCKYFSGLLNERCRRDIRYDEVCDGSRVGPSSIPCLNPELNRCDSRESLKSVEADVAMDMLATSIAMLQRGLSPCCGAKIDMSAIPKTGRYAGHGPAYCPVCGQMVFRS